MKFRNILLTTFAASAFVIGTTSCSDSFLDEKMYSSYGPEVSDVNAKLVGLHVNMLLYGECPVSRDL